MNKKLTARVQKLSKKLPQEAQSFSSTLVIEPDTNEALEKRGTIYTVYDISGGTSLNPLLVSKIIHDVLHDSYYNSDTVSPIQSLEKAIVKVKDKVTQLPEAGSSGTLDFNILVAVLWGNVLYMVQFGKGGSFLVREGQVKPINAATEGNFSEASGVVRGDDVVILGTQLFIDQFTPEELVSGSVSFSVNDLPSKASALLIKFEAVAEFTEADKIDFGTSAHGELSGENIEKKAKAIRPIKVTTKPISPITSSLKSTLTIAKKIPSKLPKITLASTGKKKVKPIFIVITGILVLLSLSIYWTLKGRVNPIIKEEQAVEITEETEVVEIVPGPDITKDLEFKIVRAEPEVFYDLKIVDENVTPTGLVVLDSTVVVTDINSGKIFTSGIITPGFDDEDITFEGISNAQYFGGDLAFTDKTGFKVYKSGEVIESYVGELGPSATYLSSIYSVSEDKLTKYPAEKELVGKLWAQSSEFEGAVSLAIDGNIYILRSDGGLVRFLSGEKDVFDITGLDKPFSDPVNIVKDFNLDNIYVADRGNNRIVILDEDGVLVSQYLVTDDSWNDIKGVGVTRDEETLFILSGSKVYTVER